MSRLASGLSILCLCLSFLGFGSVAHAQTASTTEVAPLWELSLTKPPLLCRAQL